MNKEEYTRWDVTEVLDTDEAMVAYLNEALEEKDPKYFVKALGNVAHAKGMTAKTDSVTRTTLSKPQLLMKLSYLAVRQRLPTTSEGKSPAW